MPADADADANAQPQPQPLEQREHEHEQDYEHEHDGDADQEYLSEAQFYSLMRLAASHSSGASAPSDDALAAMWESLPKTFNRISLTMLSQVLATDESDSPDATPVPTPQRHGPRSPALSPATPFSARLSMAQHTPAHEQTSTAFDWLGSEPFVSPPLLDRGFSVCLGRSLRTDELSQIQAILKFKRIDKISRQLFIQVLLDLKPSLASSSSVRSPSSPSLGDPVISFARVLACTEILASLPFMSKQTNNSTITTEGTDEAAEEHARVVRDLRQENVRLRQSLDAVKQRAHQVDQENTIVNEQIQQMSERVRLAEEAEARAQCERADLQHRLSLLEGERIRVAEQTRLMQANWQSRVEQAEKAAREAEERTISLQAEIASRTQIASAEPQPATNQHANTLNNSPSPLSTSSSSAAALKNTSPLLLPVASSSPSVDPSLVLELESLRIRVVDLESDNARLAARCRADERPRGSLIMQYLQDKSESKPVSARESLGSELAESASPEKTQKTEKQTKSLKPRALLASAQKNNDNEATHASGQTEPPALPASSWTTPLIAPAPAPVPAKPTRKPLARNAVDPAAAAFTTPPRPAQAGHTSALSADAIAARVRSATAAASAFTPQPQPARPALFIPPPAIDAASAAQAIEQLNRKWRQAQDMANEQEHAHDKQTGQTGEDNSSSSSSSTTAAAASIASPPSSLRSSLATSAAKKKNRVAFEQTKTITQQQQQYTQQTQQTQQAQQTPTEEHAHSPEAAAVVVSESATKKAKKKKAKASAQTENANKRQESMRKTAAASQSTATDSHSHNAAESPSSSLASKDDAAHPLVALLLIVLVVIVSAAAKAAV